MRRHFEYPELKRPRHFYYGPRPQTYLPLRRGFSVPGVFDMAAMGYKWEETDERALEQLVELEKKKKRESRKLSLFKRK